MAQQPAYWRPVVVARGAIPYMGNEQGAPRLRFYTHVDGYYGSSLSNASTDLVTKKEETQNDPTEAVEFGIGASGYHRWERSTVAVDYHSSFRRYSRNRPDEGGDHLLSLGLRRELTPRWKLSLAESAGRFSRQFLYNPFSALDPALTGVPRNDVFDDRTDFLSTVAEIIYQQSPRLSFGVGGRGYLVRRQSQLLVGLNSYQGNTGVAYALTPTKSISIDYGYARYAYTRNAGNADTQDVGLGFSQRLGPHSELGLRAGGYRVGQETLTQVEVNPALVPIVGRNVTLRSSHRAHFHPSLEAGLKRQFHYSSVSIGYLLGIDPGNGVYLLSRRQSVEVGYTYAGIRRMRLGFSTGYGNYRSFLQNAGQYRNFRAGGGLTYKIIDALQFVTRFDANRFEVPVTGFGKDRYQVTIGLAFVSREIPI